MTEGQRPEDEAPESQAQALTCYVHDGWSPSIRPADPRRAWMDATNLRYAYRCLPLAIANAHGWEIGSPCGFRARWSGHDSIGAVQFEFDPGTDMAKVPVSLFGSGTITFHVDGIFRTPPGWNLWVGGPPNDAKDGIAPLAAVIETDWSPYTFTMNWRFTRPNHWVRFERDETFCFFFPVQRGVLDAMAPVIRPLDDDPALKARFKQWSASRDAFRAHVQKTQPQAPADQWQKLYFRGVTPFGESGPADHQTKVRPAPFEDLRPEPAVCPVIHAPEPEPPKPVIARPTRAPPPAIAARPSARRFVADEATRDMLTGRSWPPIKPKG
jgi:hypothetical protein